MVDNDGFHGMVERSGSIGLRAGRRPIEVRFFQGGGPDGLVVSWSGPGLDKAPIPPSALSHEVTK